MVLRQEMFLLENSGEHPNIILDAIEKTKKRELHFGMKRG